MVTVALARTSSSATGMPTILERPSTTALTPFRSGSTASISSMQPAGVQGTNSGSRPFCASRPMLIGWKPSTSFSRLTCVQHAFLVQPGGQGQLHQDAVDLGVVVQGSHQLFHFALRGRGGQLVGK